MQVVNYISFFSNIKQKIREAQVKATLSANAQMIQMYWDIGNMISEKQNVEGWGANIISRLSNDLKKEMPELKGFSERNLSRMLQFSNEYKILPLPVAKLELIENQNFVKVQQAVAQLKNDKNVIVQQPVAQLNKLQLLSSIPWSHNIILIEKIKDIETRFWYINRRN